MRFQGNFCLVEPDFDNTVFKDWFCVFFLLNVNPKLSSYHRKHSGSNTPGRRNLPRKGSRQEHSVQLLFPILNLMVNRMVVFIIDKHFYYTRKERNSLCRLGNELVRRN